MGTPHKHAELIKAWADGADIEYKTPSDTGWHTAVEPSWYPEHEYRIKPKALESRWLWAHKLAESSRFWSMEDNFLTESEAAEYFKNCQCYQKLEWTRTEFPA